MTCTSKSPGQSSTVAFRRRGCAIELSSGLPVTGALTLHPSKTGRLPTGDLPSMAIGVERPLETARHIPASSIADVRHGFRCHATARAGSAYEEQVAVFSG